MIDGDLKDFIEDLSYGEEIVFLYKGCKFFVEGWCENGKRIVALQRWEPVADDFIWIKASDRGYPVKDFLEAKIFDGKTFLEIEKEVRWVDD